MSAGIKVSRSRIAGVKRRTFNCVSRNTTAMSVLLSKLSSAPFVPWRLNSGFKGGTCPTLKAFRNDDT